MPSKTGITNQSSGCGQASARTAHLGDIPKESYMKNPDEVKVEWLAWLSAREEKKLRRQDYCTFAGMSRDIPKDIRERIGIVKEHKPYCIIHEA